MGSRASIGYTGIQPAGILIRSSVAQHRDSSHARARDLYVRLIVCTCCGVGSIPAPRSSVLVSGWIQLYDARDTMVSLKFSSRYVRTRDNLNVRMHLWHARALPHEVERREITQNTNLTTKI